MIMADFVCNRSTFGRISYSVGIHGRSLHVLPKKIFPKYFSKQQKTLFYMCDLTDASRHWLGANTSSCKCFRTDEFGYTSVWIYVHRIEEVIHP